MDKGKAIVVGDRVYRSLMDDFVTKEDWKKAKEELNETPETRELLLKSLKEKLAAQKDFIPQTDDLFLLGFLRTRKFDLEKTYKMIREHYKFRTKYPNGFTVPSSVEHVLRANILSYLPHRDHLGRVIYHVRIGNWNPDDISFQDLCATGMILAEYVLDNPVTQINGYVAIWDFRDFGLKQFQCLCSPKNLWYLQNCFQGSMPGRFKEAYCVNCHELVNRGWSLFRLLLKEKLRNRLKLFGSDMNTLHEFIHPSILTKEYGGNIPMWNHDYFVDCILDKEPYFKYSRCFGYQVKNN